MDSRSRQNHRSKTSGGPNVGINPLETVKNLKTQNIGLISLEERIETTSPAGELIVHMFGAIAHFERRLISERTKDGIKAARAKGQKPGRPPLDAETVLALQNLVQARMTAGQAAKQLGIARSRLTD